MKSIDRTFCRLSILLESIRFKCLGCLFLKIVRENAVLQRKIERAICIIYIYSNIEKLHVFFVEVPLSKCNTLCSLGDLTPVDIPTLHSFLRIHVTINRPKWSSRQVGVVSEHPSHPSPFQDMFLSFIEQQSSCRQLTGNPLESLLLGWRLPIIAATSPWEIGSLRYWWLGNTETLRSEV